MVFLNSEVEDEDQALCTMQTEAMKDDSKKTSVAMAKPQTITSKLFVPRTAEMDSGFLGFSDAKSTGRVIQPNQ